MTYITVLNRKEAFDIFFESGRKYVVISQEFTQRIHWLNNFCSIIIDLHTVAKVTYLPEPILFRLVLGCFRWKKVPCFSCDMNGVYLLLYCKTPYFCVPLIFISFAKLYQLLYQKAVKYGIKLFMRFTMDHL